MTGISQEPMESVLTYSSLCLKPPISLNKGRSWVRRRARLGCRIRTICSSLFSCSLPPSARPPTAQKPGGLPFSYEAPWGGCLQPQEHILQGRLPGKSTPPFLMTHPCQAPMRPLYFSALVSGFSPENIDTSLPSTSTRQLARAAKTRPDQRALGFKYGISDCRGLEMMVVNVKTEVRVGRDLLRICWELRGRAGLEPRSRNPSPAHLARHAPPPTIL